MIDIKIMWTMFINIVCFKYLKIEYFLSYILIFVCKLILTNFIFQRKYKHEQITIYTKKNIKLKHTKTKIC